ncbi:hypothetical protein C8F04DRAFT_1193538 [Mycena alexandri]|uniref:Uncharacterized protein n=1 Tax=Mycena alexandri TaxID=1745969 RepID=A0AAD6SDE4_9AGAR|nr:hypothetical protein C8F04DRAFT_1193538 [Mycena alexandri]
MTTVYSAASERGSQRATEKTTTTRAKTRTEYASEKAKPVRRWGHDGKRTRLNWQRRSEEGDIKDVGYDRGPGKVSSSDRILEQWQGGHTTYGTTATEKLERMGGHTAAAVAARAKEPGWQWWKAAGTNTWVYNGRGRKNRRTSATNTCVRAQRSVEIERERGEDMMCSNGEEG